MLVFFKNDGVLHNHKSNTFVKKHCFDIPSIEKI